MRDTVLPQRKGSSVVCPCPAGCFCAQGEQWSSQICRTDTWFYSMWRRLLWGRHQRECMFGFPRCCRSVWRVCVCVSWRTASDWWLCCCRGGDARLLLFQNLHVFCGEGVLSLTTLLASRPSLTSPEHPLGTPLATLERPATLESPLASPARVRQRHGSTECCRCRWRT